MIVKMIVTYPQNMELAQLQLNTGTAYLLL